LAATTIDVTTSNSTTATGHFKLGKHASQSNIIPVHRLGEVLFVVSFVYLSVCLLWCLLYHCSITRKRLRPAS